MKKFLLNVLAIVSVFLICGNLTAWGEETNIIDFTVTSNGGYNKTSVITLTNGTITFSTGTVGSANDGACYGAKLDNDKKYVEVKLNDPLRVGDVIYIKEFSTSKATDTYLLGINLVIINGTTETLITTLDRSPAKEKDYETVKYTVVAGDNLAGKTTFRIKKATENSIYFSGITITRTTSTTLTTEDTDYYSLYLGYNATVPKDVTAYTGSLSADEKTLVLSQINDGVIPANTGVLVKSTVAGSYTFNQSTTDPSATSDLKGVTTATEVSALEVEGKTVLTLGTKGGVIGFRKPAGTSIGANKAYLLVTTPSGGSTAPELVIGIDDDETTGINGVKADNADVDAPMFNIAGQRVSNNAKGLVIKNGKKYMLK